jgi:serine/threonine protein kinase
LIEQFPSGKFLGEGGFKEVYEVMNPEADRKEAVSVMDVAACVEAEEQAVVQQEVHVSNLLSQLVTDGVCPNFVEVFESFLFVYRPPVTLWGSSKKPTPAARKPGSKPPKEPAKSRRGAFQYQRMELCDKGDVEALIKTQPNALLPVGELAGMMYQMAFSMFVARSKYTMRHYDVKNLNFFVRAAGEDGKAASLRYGFGESARQLSTQYVVKLADYGTADINPQTLNTPLTVERFGTLENTPIDWLAMGSQATQGYACDTWALGLCMLHLFTGIAPYEELLCGVTCPPMLREGLLVEWNDGDQYQPVKQIIAACEGADETLPDTFYRFLVMFGAPFGLSGTNHNGSDQKLVSPIWTKVTNLLQSGETKDQFDRDSAKYSVTHGEAEVMLRCRERLTAVPGSLEFLLQLTAFSAAGRPSMNSCLKAPIFDALVVDANTDRADFEYFCEKDDTVQDV